jgi:hypothetical protein
VTPVERALRAHIPIALDVRRLGRGPIERTLPAFCVLHAAIETGSLYVSCGASEVATEPRFEFLLLARTRPSGSDIATRFDAL